MPQSQALIVDDSKAAQHQLRKMLDKYDLQVETVLSAEEALDYLKRHHPNVIFLDHHMTGMDGLSALKLIKQNPETAIIPVIMYTSEKGQVYVGQARALGALDILTKGNIHPSNLDRVLKSLKIESLSAGKSTAGATGKAEQGLISNIKGSQAANEPPRPNVAERGCAPSKPANTVTSAALKQLRSGIDRQFEQQMLEMREQLADSEGRLIKLFDRTSEENKQYQQQLSGEMQSELLRTRKQFMRASWLGFGGFLMLLLIIGGFLAWHVMQLKSDLNKANALLLAEIDGAQKQVSQRTLQKWQIAQAVNQTSNALPVEVINWAMNNDLRFGYGDAPLNEQQAGKIGELLGILEQIDYRGAVNLDIRFGNVCLRPDSNNTLVLADNQQAFGDCVMLAETAPSFDVNDYISIPYVDLQESLDLGRGTTTLELTVSGMDNPYVDYLKTAATAGEWNNIALQNNRVVVSFFE